MLITLKELEARFTLFWHEARSLFNKSGGELSVSKISTGQNRKLTDRSWSVLLSIVLPILEISWLVLLGLGLYNLLMWHIQRATYY